MMTDERNRREIKTITKLFVKMLLVKAEQLKHEAEIYEDLAQQVAEELGLTMSEMEILRSIARDSVRF